VTAVTDKPPAVSESNGMKRSIVFALILFGSALSAQNIQFKGHAIGETAQQFFATATVAESHQPTVEYCTTLLNNPKAMKKHLGLAMPVETQSCQAVMASLQSMDAEVGNRFASALGPGTTRFHAGKLVYMQFIMDSPYIDVVADMSKKLNSRPVETYVTYQNGFGATFQRRKAVWVSGNLMAGVEESPSVPYKGEALLVTVFDSKGTDEAWQRREATRPSTLDP
jgi:hypothetical protein